MKEWIKIESDDSNGTNVVWFKVDQGFTFIASDAFGEPDLYSMVLLDHNQIRKLLAELE